MPEIHRFLLERCGKCGYLDRFTGCCAYLKLEGKPRPCKAKEPDDPNCTAFTDKQFKRTAQGRTTSETYADIQKAQFAKKQAEEEREKQKLVDFKDALNKDSSYL